MSKATFGPGGNSESFYAEGKKSTLEAPAWVASKGLDAYEYQGGNGITASAATLAAIGEAAKKSNILMSLHTPYFISLSGIEEEKRLKSISYIEKSIKAASLLGADTIVVHSGSASKITRAEALDLAKDTLSRTLDSVDLQGISIGLETMGKLNQLGTLEEVIELCKLDKRLVPVVDFGHLNCRAIGNAFPDRDSYRRVFNQIGEALGDSVADKLHCHFSKIEYTNAGEKKHLTFSDTVYGPNFEPLAEAIALENVSPRIICESAGTMAEDAAFMKEIYLSKLEKK